MQYSILSDENGKVISAGYTTFVAGVGQTVESMDEPNGSTLAKVLADMRERVEAVTAPYDAKVDDETITLPNLVKLLKAKGII